MLIYQTTDSRHVLCEWSTTWTNYVVHGLKVNVNHFVLNIIINILSSEIQR
jgi:hypothetical protein